MNPFSEHHLSDVLNAHLDAARKEIAALDSDYVLKASSNELEEYFISKVLIDPLALHVDQQHIASRSGIDIDVSHDFHRAVYPGERMTVRGTKLCIDIPFQGDPQLWKFRPSSFSLSGYPDLTIGNGRISLCFTFPDDSPDPARLKDEIDRDIKRLADAVARGVGDVATFNATVPTHMRKALEIRRARAKDTTDVVAALNIPLKRADQPPAYTVPTTRKKSPRSLPVVGSQPFRAEPFLPMEEYEHILMILKSMGLVIERNPQSFIGLDEEGIRTHFLIQLNGHYEGNATGETFNAAGKTDILIRIEDRNVFIAECKFWTGPAGFDDAITQLLGYLSWRDSKCALVIFNRNRDSTAVAKKIHDAMIARPEFRKASGRDVRGDDRFVFIKASDPGMEILITTILFDMPRP